MGCSASRVANEDTVRRCKERRRLMKAAVLSRHQLAAAHSDYLRSLRRAAAALSLFASFQSLSVSDKTPPVLLQPPPPPSSSVAPAPPPPPPPPPFSPALPPPPPKARSTRSGLSATASQTSSAWNWEEFYPPSPPGSDFYDRLSQQRREQQAAAAATSNGFHHLPIGEDEESELERRPKEWDDRYSATSSSSSESDGGAEEEDDDVSRSEYHPPSDLTPHASRMEIWRGEEEDGESAASMLMVLRHRDLKEIVATIEEYFDKAAAGGEGVSDLLEVGRAQLDRSFRQLKKTLYHSSSVLSTLSSTWSSRPPLAVRYQMDAREVSEGGKSHCSTLDRLLAWEKKLYEEVKAREGAKIEHEKKLSILQSQEYKGTDILKLDKTKTAIQRLQSLILVTSEAVSTTSSAIIKVRDDELAPQLIELCRGFLQMWRAMHQCHEVQDLIVQQVRGLVNHSVTVETDDLHRQATRDLESAISEWHSSFVRLVKFQRDYIRSLYGWLKLTLSQVSNELLNKDHYSSLISSELTSFCDEWKQAVDRLPDTVAAEAINSFVNVVHSISLKQKEELKIKKRVETYSKELEKKTLTLRNIERKYYRSYSMVGVGFPDRGFDDNGQIFDARDPLIEKKTEIAACRRKVDDEMARHARAIWATREMTLNNIQTGLPGLFQAMSGFSGLFAEALEDVCCRRAGPRR